MSIEYKDSVSDTTSTTGTGTVTIAGVSSAGHRTIASSHTNGATIYYRINNTDNTEWEVGTGVWDSGANTLTRSSVYASSNANNLVNFGSGTKSVITTLAAAGMNITGNATHTGDATGSTALTVIGMNGTIMSSLATGIVKNTTGTGVPSIAAAGDFPTLNQNTSGTAAGLSATLGVTSGGTGTATQFTEGSVLFAGASGIYSQDNAKFFWDDTNNRLSINAGTSPATDVHIEGAIRLSGTVQDTITTPNGSGVGTKINIPVYAASAYAQVVAMGITSGSSQSARVLSMFDARAEWHQPTLSVFNPGEYDIIGLSWDGSNTTSYLKTLGANLALKISTDSNMVELATGNKLGLSGATPVTKPTVTGSKASGAAFDSLLSALVSIGLITDTTSA